MKVFVAMLVMLQNLRLDNCLSLAVVHDHNTIVQTLEARRNLMVATFEMAVGKVGPAG
jgi:hypothetical protein